MSDNIYVSIFLILMFLMWANVLVGNFREKRRINKEIKEYPINVYINKILQRVENMTGSQFEDFVSYVFSDIGYRVKPTKKTRDGGKDLILYTKQGKVYVEIKRYSNNNLITSPLVLKLIGSSATDGVKKCIFLTTSYFTKDAIETAEKSKIDIKLIDLEGFIDICKVCDQEKILNYLGYGV